MRLLPPLGKTIAIGGMYAPPYFFALEGLKKLGLDPATEVNYIDTGGTAGALTALASGQVGAAVVTPPYDVKARELGFGELMFLGDLLDYPYGGVATSLAHIDGQPGLVKDTTRALLHSVQWWRQHPSETQDMIVAKLGIGPAEAAATYETFTRILTVTGDTKESSIRNYVKSQQPDRDVETDLALETIVNTRLLREVQAELGLK
jgi:ABC-type nitrate/sulfonate/bicarbonate transport system substrate-binding protein